MLDIMPVPEPEESGWSRKRGWDDGWDWGDDSWSWQQWDDGGEDQGPNRKPKPQPTACQHFHF